MAGMLAGIVGFAELYGWVAGFLESGALESATLSDLLGLSFSTVAALVVALALVTFSLVRLLERRRGGS